MNYFINRVTEAHLIDDPGRNREIQKSLPPLAYRTNSGDLIMTNAYKQVCVENNLGEFLVLNFSYYIF